MGTTKIIAENGTPLITIEREFDAPPELLFRAWTDPDLLVQWLGPRRLKMRITEYELRDGGRYRFTHYGDDGVEHRFRGVFHGTPSIDSLVRTFEYEGAPGHVSLEWLAFEPRGNRTLVRMNSVHQSVAARDSMIEAGMEEGVNDGMERLDELLARMAVKA
ncbi:MAG: polyketide cyclase [Dehalococcoidia bacterium]|nr:MAG: polyketide cyclase [Dehalococcoidia bacterium]